MIKTGKTIKVTTALLLAIQVTAFGRLAGQLKIDSLLKCLPSLPADTNRVSALADIAFTYGNVDPVKGLEYSAQCLKLAQQVKWKKGIGKAYNSFYSNYLNKAEYDKALEYALMSLKVNEEIDYKRNVAVNLSSIGNVYEAKGDFSRALDYQFKSLKLAEAIKEKMLVATSLMNIGNIYLEMGDLPKQLKYHQDALRIYQETGDDRGVGMCYMNLGSGFYKMKDCDRADSFFSKSLELAEQSGRKLQIQTVLGNLASNYLAQGNYAKALEFCFKTLQLGQETGDLAADVYALADIGKTYLEIARTSKRAGLPDSLRNMGKPALLSRSIFYTKQAIEKNRPLEQLALQYEMLHSLSDIYRESGDFKNALESYDAYVRIKDSVYSEDNKLHIAKLETAREADLKTKQIELNHLATIQHRRNLLISLSGIAVLLFVIGNIVRNSRKQKKANVQLAQEKAVSEKLRSELEEMLDQKSQLVEQVSEAADMKSKFLANVSHELRTPVTLLTGMLELMNEKNSGGEEKLALAYANSRRLQYMVDEILDISRLEKYEVVHKCEVKEVLPLLKRITFAFSSYVTQEKQTLEFIDNQLEGVYISTDEDMFEKILNNLIFNAVKFNKENGKVTVSVALQPGDQNLAIEIADTGKGISPADLPHIFERFYQGDSGSRSKGAGIGLSLVKEWTTLLGGTVEVSSTPGVGTTFRVSFPVHVKEEGVSELLPDFISLFPKEEWENLEQRHLVLLVEDNLEMRYYLREVLSEKVEIAEAENGLKALEWLENNTPDLIISDIMMPEMDGKQFVAALKYVDKYKKIPVITLSALADKEVQLNMLQLGIDDYIVKPFNAQELRIRVLNLLRNQKERVLFSSQSSEPDDIAPDSKQAEEFKTRLSEFVLTRMKKYEVTVYDLAYEFALSERQLYRLAKNLTGCTPAQLIKEVRLLKAYELLLSGEYHKVETVAKEVGFENVSYFARQFSERFGKRPTEFLKG